MAGVFSRLAEISLRMQVGVSQVANYRVLDKDYLARWQEAKEIWVENKVPNYLVRIEASRIFFSEVLKSKGINFSSMLNNFLFFSSGNYEFMTNSIRRSFESAIKAREFGSAFGFDFKRLVELDKTIFLTSLYLGHFDEALFASRNLDASFVEFNTGKFLKEELKRGVFFDCKEFLKMFDLPSDFAIEAAFGAFYHNFKNENYSECLEIIDAFKLPDSHYLAVEAALDWKELEN